MRFAHSLVVAIAQIAICTHDLIFVQTGSEQGRRSQLGVFGYCHTIFYSSLYSDAVCHLGELSFPPHGHPETGTHTSNLSDAFALSSLAFYDLSHNYSLTNNNYDMAVNRPPDLIIGGTSLSSKARPRCIL